MAFCSQAADFEFLPITNPNLKISFIGETQAGKFEHNLQIRQLGYNMDIESKQKVPTYGYYLIYFAGDEYGPHIIKRLPGHSPYMKQVSQDTVEIEFTMGNSGHTRQTWKLVGNTAEMVNEVGINWDEKRSH